MIRAGVRVCVVLGLLSGGAAAQWVQTAGPEGGPATFVTSNASNGYVFAVANKLPYRSTDGGVTWAAIRSGLGANLDTRLIYSVGSDTYLSGQDLTGVYYFHSTDFGTTWIPKAATGLPFFSTALAMIQSGPNLLLGTTKDTIYKSTDHGATWSQTSGLATNTWIGSFAARGSYLYAGTIIGAFTPGVYRSADNGLTWTALPTPFASIISPITCLAANANGLFVGTGTSGVQRSTDSGTVWTKINPGPLTDFASVMVATSSNLFICGPGGTIQRADADGNGWTAVNTGLPRSPANKSIPSITASGSTILAATDRVGLYRTTNAGGSWAETKSGIRCAQINGMLGESGQLFVASNSHGFFRSTNSGASWTAINSGILDTNEGWWSFLRTGSEILGGCGTGVTKYLVYRSADDGASWALSNTGYTMWETRTFLKAGGDTIFCGGLRDLFISTDNGYNWTRITASIGLGTTVLDITKSGPDMMACMDGGPPIRSIDNGVSWNQTVLGLPGGSGAFTAFARIDTVMFVATRLGAYRSFNKGFTWSAANSGTTGAGLCLLAQGEDLYIGTTVGVWKSTNRGVSWTDISDGLPASTQVNKLAADDNYLYAGTSNLGVWRLGAAGSCGIAPGATGDVNASGSVVSSDIVYLVNYVLKAGAEPVPCIAVGDVNCDGEVKSSDIIYLVNYVLKAGAAPCDVCTLVPAAWSCP